MSDKVRSQSHFDTAAPTYDTNFTHTKIGMMQRSRVHYFLEQEILTSSKLSILEINCGTGVDALWLASKGNRVTATDASAKMIEVAKQKVSASTNSNLVFQQAEFSALKVKYSGEKFDLIFSNFGGLNCVNEIELENLLHNFNALLNPNGRLVLVIMGRKCVWERVYFLLKGNFKNAIRRMSKDAVVANIGEGTMQNTYYFSPREIKNVAPTKFQHLTTKPIGLFVPPSYLDNFFKNKKIVLGFLFRLEKMTGNFSFFSDYADHYFIAFKKPE